MGWVMKGTGERWDVRTSKGMVVGVNGKGLGGNWAESLT